jgi:hypothetical protein
MIETRDSEIPWTNKFLGKMESGEVFGEISFLGEYNNHSFFKSFV